MTNKLMLSVELRALLESISNGAYCKPAVMAELCALLDEPDEPFNLQGWSIDHSAGRPILMHNKCSVIEAEQAYGLLNLIETAAQHQNNNPGWPDPLESTLAKEIINNPAAFDLAIRDLFDKICREIQAGRYYRRFSGSEPMEFTERQPAPVADQAQCEECKGWGYHENHHEGGGNECGECGGSGNAAVAVVIPERKTKADYSGYIEQFQSEAAALYNEALDDVARLNGVKP